MKYFTTDAELSSVADAIRGQSGGIDTLKYPNEFISEIKTLVRPFDENADICFWDYDGTPVYSCSFAEIQAATALPDPPDHSNDEVPLVFDCWNWTLADLQALDYPMDVGACYETADGKMHWTYQLTENTGLVCSFTTTQTPSITIDWGDGSEPELWGSSTENGANPTHTYTMPGIYHCIWDGNGQPSSQMRTEGNEALVGTFYNGPGNNDVWLGSYWNNTFSDSCVKYAVGFKRFPGNNCAFVNARSLKFFVCHPNTTGEYSSNVFQNMYSLNGLCLAGGNSYSFQQYFMTNAIEKRIRMPNSISLGRFPFHSNPCLEFYNGPLGSYTGLNGCNRLKRLVIIGNIPSGVLGSSCPLEEIWCGLDEPPTLESTTPLSGIKSSAIIHVKATALDAFQTATNWSTYANYMVGDWTHDPDR